MPAAPGVAPAACTAPAQAAARLVPLPVFRPVPPGSALRATGHAAHVTRKGPAAPSAASPSRGLHSLQHRGSIVPSPIPPLTHPPGPRRMRSRASTSGPYPPHRHTARNRHAHLDECSAVAYREEARRKLASPPPVRLPATRDRQTHPYSLNTRETPRLVESCLLS